MAKLGEYGHQLENMTAQEVFDVVTEHLLMQMCKSENEEQCLYNGGDICCAAAPFLKHYDETLDKDGNSTWNVVVERGFASYRHKDLIRRLQTVHDNYPTDGWATALEKVASHYGLQYNGIGISDDNM